MVVGKIKVKDWSWDKREDLELREKRRIEAGIKEKNWNWDKREGLELGLKEKDLSLDQKEKDWS